MRKMYVLLALTALTVALGACGVTDTTGSAPLVPTAAPADGPGATPAPTAASSAVVVTDPGLTPPPTALPTLSPADSPGPTPAPTGGPAASSDAVLAALHRSGGIAGIDETITVYQDGRVELHNGRSGQTQTGQAAPADLDALRALLASPELAQAAPRYRARGADLFTYELTLPGATPGAITTMDGAKHPEIVARLIGALVKLRPAGR